MSGSEHRTATAFLRNVRVLDLTNVLAGPFCCHQLAHVGAEVIKVELPKRGDLARQLGADPELNDRLMGASFLAQNAGKKSITLNFKSAKGRSMLKQLVATADVLVENFRPGVMDRLGLGYKELTKVNPKLVYCAISGFGQTGPLKDLPAYDQIIQGMSGVMSVTGDEKSAPLRVGYPVSDTIGGLTAAFAIAAAVARTDKERGVFIDVPMLEATVSMMGWVVSNWLVGGVAPAPHGNENVTSAPSGTFMAADGPLNIAANKEEQWEAVCRLLGIEELIAYPDYRNRELRKRNRYQLKKVLESKLSARSAAEWVAALNEAGVPAGVILTIPEALAHPQLAGNGLLATYQDVPGVGRDVTVMRLGFKVDGVTPAVAEPPPLLGADNEAIWSSLGYSNDQIESLQSEGIL